MLFDIIYVEKCQHSLSPPSYERSIFPVSNENILSERYLEDECIGREGMCNEKWSSIQSMPINVFSIIYPIHVRFRWVQSEIASQAERIHLFRICFKLATFGFIFAKRFFVYIRAPSTSITDRKHVFLFADASHPTYAQSITIILINMSRGQHFLPDLKAFNAH